MLRSIAALTLFAVSAAAWAATSSASLASPMGGNGFGLTFDGRVYLVRRGGNPDGWFATVFRPQQVVMGAEGLPRVDMGAFSPFRHVQPVQFGENALALCQTAPQPFACNSQNQAETAGAWSCYDLWVFESNAEANQDNSLFRRHLLLRTHPETNPDAQVVDHVWLGGRDMVQPTLKGIEPTMTADGQLLIYQGHPDNDGKIDILMYAHNNQPCALSGWSAGRPLTSMHTDPVAVVRWPLAERQLRAADGTLFAPGSLIHGAYPWVFPDGDAVFFTAVPVPCRATEDPPGCGPRRGALSVLGYPTTWGVAHIDGGLNPDTDQTVRLFFNSPGPNRFASIPATSGVDVWPMFGSNTSNYVELVLDDGVDGRYAGVWHMNENVNIQGELDRTRSPDTSGYFHTAQLQGGATFPLRNNGALGKAVELNGTDGRIMVPSTTALNPVNALTAELMIFPLSEVDCDPNNNFRVLLQKGPVGLGTLSLVFEQGQTFQARVRSGGVQKEIWANGSVPVNQWSHVAFTYDGTTGEMAFFINGMQTNRVSHAPGSLDATLDPLFMGGDGQAHVACPDGNGNVHGLLDEVKLSRVVRFGGTGSASSSSSSSSSAAASSSSFSSSSSAAASSSASAASSVSSASSASSTASAAASSSGGASSSSSTSTQAAQTDPAGCASATLQRRSRLPAFGLLLLGTGWCCTRRRRHACG